MYYNRVNGSTQNTNLVSSNSLNCGQSSAAAAAAADFCPMVASCNRSIECGRQGGNCYNLIMSILTAILTFSAGLIIGAALFFLVLPILPAIIIFALVMLVLLILVAVFRWCRCTREL